MKNILIVQGGGRPKGNTAQLVEHFIKGAEEAGHKTEPATFSGRLNRRLLIINLRWSIT